MRSVFGNGLFLICMTLILDYSSSVIIHDDTGLIHSDFCNEFTNLDNEVVGGRKFGEQLCPVIGKELHDNDTECRYSQTRNLLVESSTPKNVYLFRTEGQLCTCKNGEGIILPPFCIKRTAKKSINLVYVLQPRDPPQNSYIYLYDAIFYATAMYHP